MEINNSYDKLIRKIAKVRAKEENLILFQGILSSLAIVSISVLIFSLFETLFNGDTSIRTALFVLILVTILFSFGYYFMPAILKKLGVKNHPDLNSVALRIGNVYPHIKDKLCNVIQLIEKINKQVFRDDNTSKELTYAAFETIYKESINLDFEKVIDKKKYKKTFLYYFSIIFLTLIIFFTFKSSLGASLYRIINYNNSFIPKPNFELVVENKNVNLLKGSKVEIKVIVKGVAPDEIFLKLKENRQAEFDEYILKPDSSGNIYYQINSLKNSIVYYAEALWYGERIQSDTGKINIIERPFVRSLEGKIISPKYTKLTPKIFDHTVQEISALNGSKIQFHIIANKNLKQANIVFTTQNISESDNLLQDTSRIKESGKEIINLNVKGKVASGTLTVKKSCVYYIELLDSSNLANFDPIDYTLIALNDDEPSITMIQPIVDVQIDENAILPIQVAIADDYGFTYLRLYYKLIQSKYTFPMKEFKFIDIPFNKNDLTLEIPYIWDLTDVNISPEDEYEYYLEVADNDIVKGPKKAKTQSLRVKMPSLEEVLSGVEQQHEKIEKELTDLLKKAEDVKKDIQELNQDLLKKKNPKDLDWKDKKKAEDIKKQQEELNNKLEKIQEQLQEITDNLQQKNAISQETLQKYMELQKLLKEVNSPVIQQIQKNIENVMKQVNPQQMQELMKQVKFDEEKFRQSIERTMNILKRLKAEQKADAIKKQADELQNRMEELTKKMENSNSENEQLKNELSNKQEKLTEDFEKLSQEFQEFEKLLNELKDAPQKELQDAKNALNEEDTKSNMKKSQSSLKKGDFSNANKSQKKAQQNLSNFSQKMKELKSKMDEKGMKEAIRQMQKAINDMLKISENQEQIKNKTQSTDYNSTQFEQIIKEQAMINQALTNSLNNLIQLSQKSFAVTPEMAALLGDALRKMNETLEGLSERNTSTAIQNQKKALSSINQAIANMQTMLTRMKQTGSCSNPNGSGDGSSGQDGQGMNPQMNPQNFMNQLQQLAAQQQAINSAMQQLANQGSMSLEQQAKYQRLANQQSQVQKSLEQLANEQKQSMSKTGKKPGLGNLEKIAEEMKETIKDIKSGKIDQQTLTRQERILSRLLDATRSINQRDREERRESETGINRTRKSPGEIDLNTQEGRTKALQDILKSIKEGYSKDYEELIRKYFESLNESKN